MIPITALDPDVALQHAVGLAALLDLAHLVEHILLAGDGLLRPDGAVPDVLELLDVAEDDLLTGLRVALGVSVCQLVASVGARPRTLGAGAWGARSGAC